MGGAFLAKLFSQHMTSEWVYHDFKHAVKRTQTSVLLFRLIFFDLTFRVGFPFPTILPQFSTSSSEAPRNLQTIKGRRSGFGRKDLELWPCLSGPKKNKCLAYLSYASSGTHKVRLVATSVQPPRFPSFTPFPCTLPHLSTSDLEAPHNFQTIKRRLSGFGRKDLELWPCLSGPY